jgi:hypothetical protein
LSLDWQADTLRETDSKNVNRIVDKQVWRRVEKKNNLDVMPRLKEEGQLT